LLDTILPVVIFPAFLLFFIYIMGKQFDVWDKYLPKIKDWFGNRGLPDIQRGISTIDFKGITKFFRRD